MWDDEDLEKVKGEAAASSEAKQPEANNSMEALIQKFAEAVKLGVGSVVDKTEASGAVILFCKPLFDDFHFFLVALICFLTSFVLPASIIGVFCVTYLGSLHFSRASLHHRNKRIHRG